MSEWIGVDERLPELNQPVWVLFSKHYRTKLPYVMEAAFRLDEFEGESFCVGQHENTIYSTSKCSGHKLTHWQPRADQERPVAQLFTQTPPAQGAKRRYNMTLEGTASKSRMMKSYWERRKQKEAM